VDGVALGAAFEAVEGGEGGTGVGGHGAIVAPGEENLGWVRKSLDNALRCS
jgi:hypothetical protein